MNNYENELRLKWNSINYHNGGSKQLNIEHSLEWHVRYADRNHKCLVIVSESPVDSIASSKSIEATCNLRNDGRYAITFTLIDRDQEDVFITMSCDIIKFSKADSQPQESLKLVLRRYSAWLKLLDHKRSAFLSAGAQKGLLAELVFLKECIELGIKPCDAIEGWVGPDGADQDFVYNDGWHEIKATGVSSSKVTITSVEQLSNSSVGELVIFRIDKCVPTQPGALTLYNTVHTLMGMMSADINAIDSFVLKLGAVGYIDMDEYAKQYFSISAKQSYTVNDSFPKIVRSNLPIEIINVEYQIDIPSLNRWAK